MEFSGSHIVANIYTNNLYARHCQQPQTRFHLVNDTFVKIFKRAMDVSRNINNIDPDIQSTVQPEVTYTLAFPDQYMHF